MKSAQILSKAYDKVVKITQSVPFFSFFDVFFAFKASLFLNLFLTKGFRM